MLEGRKQGMAKMRNYGGTYIYIYLRNVVEGVCGPNGGLQIAKENAGQ